MAQPVSGDMSSPTSPRLRADTDGKVADVIERLGVGPFLAKEIMLGSGIWLSAGAQVIVISSITWVIAREWELVGWQRSSVVSVLFVGKLVGNLAGGPFSDTIGRRLPVVISYAGVCVYGATAAFPYGFKTLCVARFSLGFVTGAAQCAWGALCSEITPANFRMAACLASSAFFVVGEIYGGYLVWVDDPQLKDMNWSWLTLMATLPALIFGVAAFISLRESASWLSLHGQNSRAKGVLQSIQWWNGKEQETINFTPAVVVVGRNDFESLRLQVDVAFGPTLQYTTYVLCFTCFVLNFVYYGGIYSFPKVLGHIDMGVSPAGALILGVLWEIPGFIAAAYCNKVCGRRWSILACFLLLTGSIMIFIKGAEHDSANGHHGMIFYYMTHAGYAGFKCWINTGFLVGYQYIAEVYPTTARAAGTGFCLGMGRLASIGVPFVYEALVHMYKDTPGVDAWQPFFFMMGMLCLVNALLCLFLPFETWGVTLKDHIDEMAEAEPLLSLPGRKPEPIQTE